ncbi:hypothetical protein [Candidatus Hodgkinia cicadicola]|uniref:hypothetical protein n=1 Tax=Candidatus Hodgkinia cicadicola TaxID=573658 RepID=UPI001788C853
MLFTVISDDDGIVPIKIQVTMVLQRCWDLKIGELSYGCWFVEMSVSKFIRGFDGTM